MSRRPSGKAHGSTSGEIWWVVLDPTLGFEIQKTRPCLIVSLDALSRIPVRIVVPLTSWQDKHERRSWCVPIPANRRTALQNISAADALQVRCVATQRLRNRIGHVDAPTMTQVRAALALCLDIQVARQ